MITPRLRTFLKALCYSALGILILSWLLSFLITWPRPRQLPAPPPPAWQAETFSVLTRDGIAIAGEYIPGRNTASVILLAHGIGHNRRQMDPHVIPLRQAGYPVVSFDLRGHGQSGGRFQTLGIREARDVEAVRDWAVKRLPQAGVILWGFSLGGAAVLQAAAASDSYRAVIIQGCFARISETIDVHARVWAGLPEILQPLFRLTGWFFRLRLDWLAENHDPVSVAPNIQCPVMLVTGLKDQKAPPEAAREIFRSLRSAGNELLLVPDHGHYGTFRDGSSEAAILDFIQRQR